MKLYSTKSEPCSTTYGEREIQIKTIMSHHYNPIRMAKIQTHTAANAGEELEQQELSYITGRKQMVQSLGKRVWCFLQNLTYSYHMIQQSYLLVFIQRTWKCMSIQKTYIQMFAAALFITVQTCKPPKCFYLRWMDK